MLDLEAIKQRRMADLFGPYDARYNDDAHQMFLAHAKQDIDNLMAQVERLRATAGAYLEDIEASNAGTYEECERPAYIDSEAYYALHRLLGTTPI